MDEPSDGYLLADFTAGSPTALTLLVQRHQAALLRHARSLLGNGGAYEDAVQEAFLRLVEKPPVLPESALGNPTAEHAQLSSWLHRVVRNCCMDTMRSESRRRHREEVAASPEETRGGFGSLEARDTRAAVEAGLARLPEDQREVLALRLLAERSYREIAEITGRKIGTVGWLVSVGIRALSRELAPLVGWVEGTQRSPAQEQLGFVQGAQGELP